MFKLHLGVSVRYSNRESFGILLVLSGVEALDCPLFLVSRMEFPEPTWFCHPRMLEEVDSWKTWDPVFFK